MKALISPNESPISHVVSWSSTAPIYPISEPYLNSCRVAQVEDDANIFPVAEPMFWFDCSNEVIADQWYYDTENESINKIVNAPKPVAADQPATTGTQTA